MLHFDVLPQPIQSSCQQLWQRFQDACDADTQALIDQLSDEQQQQLTRFWAGSEYAANELIKHPHWLTKGLESFHHSLSATDYQDALAAQLVEVDSEDQLHRCLRQFRNQAMLRIIWRDLNRLADTDEITAELSHLADSCIHQALGWLYQDVCKKWGTPQNAAGEPQQLVVIGMGKLGAQELNLSSDIDLMFCFPENGATCNGQRCMDNQSFFNRLGQKLIQALDTPTVDGFGFRVDMRLRPYGRSGILVPHFAAMEDYYQNQGRDWERYAMIKARVVGGDYAAGQELLANLRPFVYRKYLDFSAIDSLRSMKEMINKEVRRRNLQTNIKLGPGGIREIEFIAQAFQLIRGGRDVRLQQRQLRDILPLLPETVGMEAEAVDELLAAYRFLRDTEHALQAVNDEQTQTLPVDESEQARLAYSLGFNDWTSFSDTLQQHRQRVEEHFAEVIQPEESQPSEIEVLTNRDWQDIWQGLISDDKAQRFLAQHQYEDPEQTLGQLKQLRESRRVVTMQTISRERLDEVMPLVLDAVTNTEQPGRTLERVLQLVEAVLRRSAYFSLLIENPGALRQLVHLCAASPWFAEQLSRQPILLDELIDAESLYSPPCKRDLEDELHQQLLRIPEDDTEQLMDSLRHFKNAHVLRVAAAEISSALPLMKVSDYLTFIAEVILQGTLDIAWRMLTSKYGSPLREPGVPCDPDFIIVGYGKMGGIELSYGSDLDLVFIHDADTSLTTDGAKSIDCQVFFTRLGQRIIHLLNTATNAGKLYEVDMRLRPSGASGLLVSSLKAFEYYQGNNAWTWEHQALVRARVVAGCPKLKKHFEDVRGRILSQPRELEKLREDVLNMRLRMRQHLGSKPKPGDRPTLEELQFHLKQDPGGIVDIEFIVQFAVLAYSHQHPELLGYSDNIRVLECIEQLELIPPEDARLLQASYIALRAAAHRQALQNLSNLTSGDTLVDYREEVTRIWQSWLEPGAQPNDRQPSE